MLKRSAFILAAALFAAATAVQAAPAEHRDEASVRTVENRWSEAFMTGDSTFLDDLLDPAYVSVGQTGVAHAKADIIAMAKKYAAKNPGQHANPMPATSTIELMGTTALVRHHGSADVSIDLFAFESGHWRAKYSQHTALAPG
jgi:hypothetical protein